MKDQISRHVSVLRTTAIGGIFFLLPLAVFLFFLGQIGQVIYVVATNLQPVLNEYLHIHDYFGYSLIFLISITLIGLACFVAGIMARRSFARQFTRWIEKYLLMMFPRYAIFKEQLSGNIGGSIAKNKLRPVCVRLEGFTRLAFEVERARVGEPAPPLDPSVESSLPWLNEATVTLFLPGSPDPWAGTVINVTPDRVQRLDVSFPDLLGSFEKLGADTQKLLRGQRLS